MDSKARDRAIVKGIKEGNLEGLTAILTEVVGAPFDATVPVNVRSFLNAAAVQLVSLRRVRDGEAWVEKLLARADFVEVVEEVVIEPEQPIEKVATRKRNRPYLQLAEICLKAGKHNKEELIGTIMVAFPGLNRVTIDTFVIDLRNSKYTAFPDRRVVRDDEGRLKFAN